MKQGYIKLHRKLLDSPIFTSDKGLRIWIWCLLKAEFKEKDAYIGRTKRLIKPGQFIFGRHSASEELDIAPSTIWSWICLLQKDNFIDIEKTTQCSVVSIKNWEDYQTNDNERKTNEKQTDTIYKNVKNDKNIYRVEKKIFKYPTIESIDDSLIEIIARDYKVTQKEIRFVLEELKVFKDLDKYVDFNKTLRNWVLRAIRYGSVKQEKSWEEQILEEVPDARII